MLYFPRYEVSNSKSDLQGHSSLKGVDDTVYHRASTPSWTQITVVDGQKFYALRCLSHRLLGPPKTRFLTIYLYLVALLEVTPSRCLASKKIRFPKLLCGVVHMILHFGILVPHQLVKDRQLGSIGVIETKPFNKAPMSS